jgi:hypothetical protein
VKPFVSVMQIWLLLGSLAGAADVRAAPDFQNVKVYELQGEDRYWTLLGDRDDPRLYYRFPDYFTVKTDDAGRPLIRSLELPNGDVRLSFLWGMRDYRQDESELRTLIRAKDGVEPVFVDLVPQLERLEIDPDLNTLKDLTIGMGQTLPLYLLPDDAYVLELTIPKKALPEFMRRVVAGSGYTLFLQLYYQIRDTRIGAAPLLFPFASSLLISGLRVCDLKPKLSCGGL